MATFKEVIFKLSVDTGNSEQDVKDLTKQLDRLDREIDQLEEGTLEYEKALRQIALVQRQLRQSSRDYSQQVERTDRIQRRATGGLNRMSQGFQTLRAGAQAFLALAVVQQFAQLATASLKAAANLEKNAIAFETFLGSAEKAQVVLAALTEFANITPFKTDEVITAGKTLLAFGESAAAVTDTLGRIGSIASGVGAPLNELAQIYGKVRVQGRLFAEDVNQFTGRGIPVIQEFAKQFGVTEKEVRKLVETGQIGFPQLEKAFQDLTGEGGKFFGLIEKQSQSLSGLLSTLQGKFTSLLASLSEESGLVAGSKETLNTLIKLVDAFNIALGDSESTLNKVGGALSKALNNAIPLVSALGFVLDQTDESLDEFLASAQSGTKVLAEFKKEVSGLGDLDISQRLLQEQQAFANAGEEIRTTLGLLRETPESELLKGALKDEIALQKAIKQRIAILELEQDARNKTAKQREQFQQEQAKKELNLSRELQALILQNELKALDRISSDREAETQTRLDAIDSIIVKTKELNALRVTINNEQEKDANKRALNRKKLEFALQDDLRKANEDRIKILLQDSERLEKALFNLKKAGAQRRAEQEAEAQKKIRDEFKKSLEAQTQALRKQQAEINQSLNDFTKVFPVFTNEIATLFANAFKVDVEDLGKVAKLSQEVFKQFATIAAQSINAVFDLQEERLNSQIDLQKERVSQAEALAEKGNTTALELERKRLDELERRREAAARRDNAITAVQTAAQIGLAIARTAAQSNIFAGVAIPALLGIITGGFSLIPSLISGLSGFETGGFTGQGNPKDVAGLVHKGEQVITAKQLRDPAFKETSKAIEVHRKTGVFTPPTQSQSVSFPDIRIDKLEAQQAQTNELLTMLLGQRASMSVTQHGIKYAYDSVDKKVNKLRGKV